MFAALTGSRAAFGVALAAPLIVAFSFAQAPGTADLEGFSSRSTSAEAQLEQRFDASLSASELRDWMEPVGVRREPCG